MKLSDWINRAPASVSFGLGGGGGGSTSFVVSRNTDTVSLVTVTGIETELPAANQFDAGLMSSSDKTKLDGLSNTTVAVDPSNFESRAQVTATNIDPSVNFIRTAGFTAHGDGGSALYARRTTQPAHKGRIQSADGAHWELVPEYGEVNSKQFGEVGDLVADDTQAIQNTIDFALYHNANTSSGQPVEVLIVGPRCRTTDTIHLGYGVNAFQGVSVRGTTSKRRAEPQNVGTAIVADFTDRPIINIQGARQTQLREIWLEGKLNYTSIPSTGTAPLSAANWTSAGGEGRHNPYAAISIDAYAGPRPTPSYPDVVYPSFFGVVSQYSKLTSSEIRIEHVGMRNVNTAIVVQPCNIDANGDFIKIDTVNFENCKYGISIGNGQSRNVEIHNVVGQRVFTVFANGVHGKQSGRFGGPITNCSFAGFIGRIFEFTSTSTLGTTLIENLYTESLHRIGDFVSGTSAEGTLTFESCLFGFRHTSANGVPANILGGTNTTDLVFRGCRFQGAPSVYSIQPPNISFDNCRIEPSERASGTLPLYKAFAHNALAGGLVRDLLQVRPHRVRFKKANLDTGVLGADLTTEEGFYRETNRASGIPLWVWEFGRFSELYGEPRRKRLQYYERLRNPGVHFSSVSMTGRTLTLVFNALDDDDAFRFGVLPGDVIRDRNNGMVFFITSRIGNTVSAEAQNNYVDDGEGGTTLFEGFDTTIGGLQFMNSRIYSPGFLTFGTFTQGSPVATAVGRTDGFGGYLPSDIQPGDYLFADQDPDFIFANGESEVISIDGTAGTITFAGNARKSVTRKELTLWIRKAPANPSA